MNHHISITEKNTNYSVIINGEIFATCLSKEFCIAYIQGIASGIEISGGSVSFDDAVLEIVKFSFSAH